MLLKAALNGARSPAEHAALPVLPHQLAAASAAAVAAGAGAIHLHVRGSDGKESLAPSHVAQTLSAVREACPGIPIGLSTGAWIEPDPARRAAAVRSWHLQPDFASVNFHEPGAAVVAEELLQRGVGVEAGLAGAAAAAALVTSGLAGRCLRILLEPQEGDLAAATATVLEIEAVLDGASVQPRRLLHGTGPTAWPHLALARERGYDARIGLEDTLILPDGRRPADNAQLVAAAIVMLRHAAPSREA
jgi:uncharacterized protein (DUF849 family)